MAGITGTINGDIDDMTMCGAQLFELGYMVRVLSVSIKWLRIEYKRITLAVLQGNLKVIVF